MKYTSDHFDEHLYKFSMPDLIKAMICDLNVYSKHKIDQILDAMHGWKSLRI